MEMQSFHIAEAPAPGDLAKVSETVFFVFVFLFVPLGNRLQQAVPGGVENTK